MLHKKNITIALSGGIDSAVAAAILKKGGYNLRAVFMELIPKRKEFAESQKKINEAEKNALAIAKVLKIPFFSLDLSKEFKKEVIDKFLDEYKKGRTPNPCIICNKKIRFDLFLKRMKEKGADFVATGHYVRSSLCHSRPASGRNPRLQQPEYESAKVIYKLFQAKDKEKDQSYFLYNLRQNQLKYLLFPLGGLTKKEVRKLAKNFNLPVHDRPESQEICFVSEINKFLSLHLKPKPGIILDTGGEKIGEHQGLIFYTIGQRKKIGIGGTGPYYVVEKNLKNNNLIVSSDADDPLLYKKELIAEKVNWISGQEPKLPLEIKAKTRYRQKMAEAVLTKNKEQRTKNKNYKVKFKNPQWAITPGQSVVFYQKEELLGGGIIA